MYISSLQLFICIFTLIHIVKNEPSTMEDPNMNQKDSFFVNGYCLNKSLIILENDNSFKWKQNNDVFNSQSCENLKVSKGQYRCCYMEISINKGDFYSGCHEITKVHYHDMKDYYKEIEDGIDSFFGGFTKGYDMEYLDCNSKYLKITLMIFLMLLFFVL